MKVFYDHKPDYPFSYEEVIAHPPGVFFEAQDGTVCMVASSVFGEPHKLVMFGLNPRVLKDGKQGYCRFMYLGPFDIELLEQTER
jgi:hypothetical protein